MPLFLRDETSLLFMHVPKTGGTSIERLFKRAGFAVHLRGTRRTEGPELFDVRRCSPQHYQGSLVREMFRLDRFDAIFMLVRDPVARFRSEYAMRNKLDVRTDARSVEEWAEATLARFAADPYIRDNHLRPQHEFELPGTLVYRLEDGLESAVADLAGRLGLDLPLEVPHAMSRKRTSGVSSGDVEVSASLEKRLREFYAEDFSRYGY